MRTSSTVLLVLVTIGLATGCLSEQRFMGPEGGGPWVISIDETTPPFMEGDDGALYLVEQRVEFAFREPTAEELGELGNIAGQQVPWATLPWLRRGDIEVQIDWTLSNVTDATVQADVIVNGFNEFHEYNPGAEIVDDMVLPDFSQWERSIRLGPGERRSGTIREEELDEVAVDLSTVVNGVPNANQIVYFENQSGNDQRSQMYIPDVVAALTGVRIGLRTESPAPVVLEVTVRVRAERPVLVQGGDMPWVAPTPVLFGPADAAPPMMMTP